MDIDLKKYIDLFFQESREYLELFFSHLSKMSGAHFDAEAINELFRAAHSIKGMAASVEFDDIVRLSHALENLFDRLKKIGKAPSKRDISQIYEYVRALESLIEKYQGKDTEAIDLDSLIKKIESQSAEIDKGQMAGDRKEKKEDRGEKRANREKINIEVVIDTSVESPSIRAYMALRKLKEFGEVLSSSPSVSELRNGKFDGNLNIMFLPAGDINKIKEEVLRVNGVMDIKTFKVEDKPIEPKRKREERIKVKTGILDTLLSLTGELIVAEARLFDSLKKNLTQQDEIYFENLSLLIARVKETVLSARLLPLSFLTDRLPRVVLESAQKTGKEVELIVKGEDIEIDRLVLDSLHDPLTHIIRNSVDHGIESPEEREKKGKIRTGRIEINARRTGEYVEVSIIDDGRGMDGEALKQKALSMGLVTEERAAQMSYNEALYLSCLPGLSTRSDVTATSGRGVGLDVVKSIVEAHGGTLFISSTPGTGTEISLRLPLNISIIRTLILKTGDEEIGIPLSRVERVMEISNDFYAQDYNLYELNGEMIKIISARRFFGMEISIPGVGILVNAPERTFILGFDVLVDIEDLYVMPVPRPLGCIKGISGVSILGSGKPIFILDPYYMGGDLFHELH